MTIPINSVPAPIGVLAEPLSVVGVKDSDIDGHVPFALLTKGTFIRVPIWDDFGKGDQLIVYWTQNNGTVIIYDNDAIILPTKPYIEVPLSAQQMAKDGIAYIQYRVWKRGGNNSDDSPPRKLTIDHAPLLRVQEARFLQANPWGYINNQSFPPVIYGVVLRVPSTTGVAVPGDRSEVEWIGYYSLNISGDPVPGTHSLWSKTIYEDDIKNGYQQLIPFERYVRPLFDNDSASAKIRIFRGARQIAESEIAMAKLDRVIPGDSGPYSSDVGSLNIGRVAKMKLQIKPAKARLFGTSSSVKVVDSIVDVLVDGSVHTSILNSGKLPVKANNFLDPQDNDEIEVEYKVEGATTWLSIPGYFDLGPKDGRDDPVVMEIDSTVFKELQTPATPTPYLIRYKVYKGGGNNSDFSSEARFLADFNPVFGNKITGVNAPPTPAVTIRNMPAAPARLLDETWMKNNPKVLATVPVAYALRYIGDVLEYFLTAGAITLSVFKGAVPASGEFEFDSAILRTLPNLQRVSHSYDWTDVPGNKSARSVAASLFDLRLAQDPELLDPQVPKTDPGQTVPLTLDDFDTTATPPPQPVFAIIKQPLHGIADDEITLRIHDAFDETRYVEYGPEPLGTGDVSFELTYEKLKTLFDVDATQPTLVRVTYTHERANKITDGPGINILLSFEHGGPDYPEKPGLINPNLNLVVVKGDSKTDNTILPGDRGKAGTANVAAWFGSPPITGKEEVDFYINDKRVGGFKPFGGETEFETVVTAADIDALPTGIAKARWTVKLIGQTHNIIKSLEQDIVVNARKIPLKEPTIKIRKGNEYSCFTMVNVATNWQMELGIPKNPNLKPGMTITVFFVGVTDITGGTEVAGTKDSQTYVIKATGTQDFALVGTAAKFKLNQQVRGVKTFGKAWYEVDIGGLQVSEPLINVYDIHNTSFKYCDLELVPE